MVQNGHARALLSHIVCTKTTSLDPLHLRLALGSHLAHYIRSQLESEKGYTATAGVSTNKLLAKLVGSTYKPNAQTTLLPPYVADDETTDNVTSFMDDHEVGKIPGIGFKIAQKLRAYALHRPADFHAGLVYGDTKENVLVRDVRACPDIGPETLQRVLGGSGVPKGIGAKVWGLLNGCDEAEVGQAREVPRQISIEDSYIRLERIEEVIKELRMLAGRLLERMYTDLLEEYDDVTISDALTCPVPKRWLARPKTIRLSTRPRPPQNADGSRNRSFARISKSAQMPTFVFSLKDGMDVIVSRLSNETLVPLFRKLHPEKRGWNLSLINLAATNMVDAASETGGTERDIGKMFKRQDAVLKQWRIEEPVMKEAPQEAPERVGSEDAPTPSQEGENSILDNWESEDEDMMDGDSFRCDECGALMPTFAMGAHYRWHAS
ncbi:DinP Nucleotidyltransferase DNA polymerase [Pyrenophora tritici-repentis]|uniref:DNA polymerase iota n=1 Tax=Pyrenophora tritici-repentis TaxID=45151 RepID=A0A2W1GY53_9PLEO|nr:DNA polymerase iota [Pyrenophora tritici-repentis]KAF7449619.1 DNA polymerase iota [Pyrenophora tritici-repentis]KAF7570262.1 DinP, Nucleotidyltransferase-DNA polymerase involved in DNA repair [Pyrenophora tritici-repentis]KAI0575855.1 DNA polymerase iota [Pyrenophora tritici-repentis]KAI0580603.1 DNA polymerase iota [Pyrenophora tritici-repentis]